MKWIDLNPQLHVEWRWSSGWRGGLLSGKTVVRGWSLKRYLILCLISQVYQWATVNL